MENKNKNQPAFPAHDGHMYYGGLTQREYASIMAMQGLLSFYGLKGNRINESNLPYNVTYMEEIARYSVRQADALLKALETPKQ